MDKRLKAAVSRLPEELKLLLEWMQGDGEKTALSETEGMRKPDGVRFLHLAEHHRVFPNLSARLRRHGDRIAPEIGQKLRQLSDRNALRMLQLTAEMIEVSRLLQAHGVRSIVLKGPVLAQRLYGDLSLRTSKDLDLLVAPDQIEAVESILIGRGYRLDDRAPRILNDMKWKTHHVAFTIPGAGIQIEVHWRMNPDTIGEPSFDELWERRSKISISGFEVNGLGLEDLFVYLVTHGARHGWFRLRWLADIDRLLRMPLDHESLHHLLKRNECRRLAGQAAILCRLLLNTPIPEAMLPYAQHAKSRRLAVRALDIISNIVNYAPHPNSKDVNKLYKLYMVSILSFRQKLMKAYGKLYPSSWDAQLLPLPRLLHFLYFPLRPVLWVLRRYRAQPSWTPEDSK